MKFKYIKSIVSAALFLSLTTGMTSCINDLDISPIDPQMTATFDQDMYFTKLYASLGLTGQKLSEDPDIAVKDEGQSCFYRALFTNNESNNSTVDRFVKSIMFVQHRRTIIQVYLGLDNTSCI